MVSEKKVEKWAILGGSRGLGRALALALSDKFDMPDKPKRVDILDAAEGDLNLLLVSRKLSKLNELKNQIVEKSNSKKINIDILSCDFSDSSDENVNFLVEKLTAFSPARIAYVAGGGPYGKFGDKQWKDHQWALQVSLVFPMRLTHALLASLHKNSSGEVKGSLKQLILVGSAIAESSPDPNATSYCVAKHGLVGLVGSLQLEYPQFDIRLFSPGYMNTDLLTPGAMPRQTSEKIFEPSTVAADMLQWSLNQSEFQRNRRLT